MTGDSMLVEETRSPGGVGAALRNLLAIARFDPGLAALVVMALFGLGDAVYLTSVHYAKVPLVCSTTGLINCAAVTSSQWSVVPHTQVPITIPGMLWFLVSGGLAIVLLRAVAGGTLESRRLRQAQLIWGALGALTVLYLVYVEIVELHKLCEWCTVVHLLTFASFVVIVDRYSRVPLVAAAVPAPRASAQWRSSSSVGAGRSSTQAPSAARTRPGELSGGHTAASPRSSARRAVQKPRSRR